MLFCISTVFGTLGIILELPSIGKCIVVLHICSSKLQPITPNFPVILAFEWSLGNMYNDCIRKRNIASNGLCVPLSKSQKLSPGFDLHKELIDCNNMGLTHTEPPKTQTIFWHKGQIQTWPSVQWVFCTFCQSRRLVTTQN